jgi:hypothetical protein
MKQNPPAKLALAPRYIPIQCHIIRQSDGTGGIDVDSVDAAIEIVNMRYAPIEFHFFRCTEPNYIDDDDYFDGVIQGTSDITDLVNTHAVASSVNIFFGPSIIDDDSVSTLCGFARFPWAAGNYLFMDNGCTMNGSTLSHELGHYFGLYHTHHSDTGGGIPVEHVTRNAADVCYNCDVGGDLLCDTEADPELSNATVDDMTCAYTGGANETCTDPNPDQILPYNPDPTNLMSYSRKECRDFFSPGQYARLVSFYNSVRMAQLDPTICPNSPCYDGDVTLPMGGGQFVTTAKTARAEHSITSTEIIQVLTPPGVTYKAGGFVQLDPGFATDPGAIFTAFIEECFAASKPAGEKAGIRSGGSDSSNNGASVIPDISAELAVMPNPFADEVSIRLTIPEAGFLSLRVANTVGVTIETIVANQFVETGIKVISWNGVDLPPGVYWIVSEQGSRKFAAKMVKL